MDTNRPAGPSHGHGVSAEPDRVPTRVVVGFGVLLAILFVVAGVLTVMVFKAFDRGAEKKDTAAIAAAGLERRPDAAPPPPRLQVYPVRHWKEFREAEQERLTTYGWMDRSSGAVHVPIDRAMELIAERGVGPLPAAPMAVPGPQTMPTPAAGAKK